MVSAEAMDFILLSLGAVGFIVLVLVLVARAYPGSGADEALLGRPDGVVLEAPTSTIFWGGGDGGLRTPSISSGILASITRAHIVRELDVEEGEFQLDELMGSAEAFLASTLREVQPITAIDARQLEGSGSLTQQATAAFGRVVREALG